jgi:lipoyl(octanoyl) transferase
MNKMNQWLLFKSGPGSPEMNMALDEALLEIGPSLVAPVLRFYSWNPPAATFGYFQKFAEVVFWTSLRPLIRRPTGGGLVPHDADWTYSLIVPPHHGWYRISAIESYRRLHQWISSAFQRLDVATELAPTQVEASPGRCFAGAEKFDLLWNGKKLAGAAQRRTRNGLLVQGSIQPQGIPCGRDAWENAMTECTAILHEISWIPLERSTAFEERAQALALSKYSMESYNQRR